MKCIKQKNNEKMISALRRPIVMLSWFLRTKHLSDSRASRVFCATTERFVVMSRAACCNLKLMDTSQQVVIETGRALTPGVYRAASVQVCTTEEMLIQVWTPINNETYQLKWRTQFTPTAANTLQTWVTVIIASRI